MSFNPPRNQMQRQPIDRAEWPYLVHIKVSNGDLPLNSTGPMDDPRYGVMIEWLWDGLKTQGNVFAFVYDDVVEHHVPSFLTDVAIMVWQEGHFFYFKNPDTATLFKLTFG